ncbi:MAG TPA: type II toxin-antitoxin system VapC family toxin [Vicinamibacteria bacterium]|nr:type II toxin-antitoxin system VapC family toxin [Vicinamibacteria bacterium]
MDGRAREVAYARLFYRRWICLPFDSAAATVFDRLRAQKLRLGTNDLAIAAITLSVGATLVTRNIVDFERIPSLQFEDWGR